jgi:hypothetical protein
MLSESGKMYGVVVWNLAEAWREIDKIQSRLDMKMLGLSRFAANSVAKLELQEDSWRAKVMCLMVKYWFHLLYLTESIREYYK